jgi:hypothetical protein
MEISVETFAQKVAMCETLYKMGTLVHKIKKTMHDVLGPEEGSEVLSYWRQYRTQLA